MDETSAEISSSHCHCHMSKHPVLLWVQSSSEFHFTSLPLWLLLLVLFLRLLVGSCALLFQGAQLLISLLDGNKLGLGFLLLLGASLHLVRVVNLRQLPIFCLDFLLGDSLGKAKLPQGILLAKRIEAVHKLTPSAPEPPM